MKENGSSRFHSPVYELRGIREPGRDSASLPAPFRRDSGPVESFAYTVTPALGGSCSETALTALYMRGVRGIGHRAVLIGNDKDTLVLETNRIKQYALKGATGGVSSLVSVYVPSSYAHIQGKTYILQGIQRDPLHDLERMVRCIGGRPVQILNPQRQMRKAGCSFVTQMNSPSKSARPDSRALKMQAPIVATQFT